VFSKVDAWFLHFYEQFKCSSSSTFLPRFNAVDLFISMQVKLINLHLEQNWVKIIPSSNISSVHTHTHTHTHNLNNYPHLQPSSIFVTINSFMLIQCYFSKSRICIKVHSWCVDSVGFGKGVMRCISHYSIIQNTFTALNFLWALLLVFPFILTLGSHWSFRVFIDLSYPKYQMVRITQYVIFFRLASFTL
jgi:hypothetical protein